MNSREFPYENSQEQGVSSVPDLCELIWELENSHKLFDFKFMGIQVWPIIRMRIFYKSSQEFGLYDFQGLKPKTKTIIKFLDIIKSVNIFKIVKALCAKELVFDTGRHEFHNGKKVNIYFHGHIDESCKNFQRVWLSHAATEPHEGGKYFSEPLLFRFINLLRRYIVQPKVSRNIHKLYSFSRLRFLRLILPLEYWVDEYPSEKNKIDQLYRILKSKLKIKGSPESFIYGMILEFRLTYFFYRILFVMGRAKCVYITNSYSFDNLPKVIAAKKSNVKVIEVQHGVITKYHMGYNYPHLKKQNANFFPDEFFCWGNFWKKSVFMPLSDDKIIIKGFPYLRINLNKYTNIPKKENRVLVVSQAAIGRELIIFLNSIVLNDNIEIILRPHPAESEIINSYEGIDRLLSSKNILIDSSASLHKSASECEFVMGAFSTAIYESIAIGCKPIIVALPGWHYLKSLINEYEIPLISFGDNLTEAMSKSRRSRPLNISDFF